MKNVIGYKIGKLEIISIDEDKTTSRRKYYKCQCQCGNETSVRSDLLFGKRPSKSCGCLQRDFAKRLRSDDGNLAKSALYQQYKNIAKTKLRDFKLSKDEFLKITKCKCRYCGKPPSQIYKKKRRRNVKESTDYDTYVYNGVDRINSSEGYIKGNVVPACKDCNYAKNSLSEEEFKILIENIYNNWIST